MVSVWLLLTDLKISYNNVLEGVMTIFIVYCLLHAGKKSEWVLKSPSRARAARIPSPRRIRAAEESHTVWVWQESSEDASRNRDL